jgi:hypothetical protein
VSDVVATKGVTLIEIALLGVVAVMERSGDKERKQEGQM